MDTWEKIGTGNRETFGIWMRIDTNGTHWYTAKVAPLIPRANEEGRQSIETMLCMKGVLPDA